MLNKNLISTSIPSVKLSDTVFQAMEMMNEYYVKQLPVVTEDKYIGLVFEEDLVNNDDNTELENISSHLSKVAVHGHMHFLDAVQTANDYHLSVVPVIEKENDFLGVILVADLLRNLGKMSGASELGGLLVLEMDQRNFSFAEISKLIETNDAQITQLNTFWDNTTETFIVTIKINKFEISDIVATFQKYDYQVKYYFGEELYENELKDNYDHLMNYLSI
ncbi:MAG: CBS domain-containing protein [Chitinophagaceae bacterium]|nr:CBS domain-containing protein [Chitinophagaceae bacterium]